MKRRRWIVTRFLSNLLLFSIFCGSSWGFWGLLERNHTGAAHVELFGELTLDWKTDTTVSFGP
jgi:hypothetical protein